MKASLYTAFHYIDWIQEFVIGPSIDHLPTNPHHHLKQLIQVVLISDSDHCKVFKVLTDQIEYPGL